MHGDSIVCVGFETQSDQICVLLTVSMSIVGPLLYQFARPPVRMRSVSLSLFVGTLSVAIAGCSMGRGDGDRQGLTGPPRAYETHERSRPRARYERSQPRERYDAQPAYHNRRPMAGGCTSERVAARPYPRYVTVVRGDNLCRIAKRYQTTVQALVDVNRLPSPMLSVGAQLKLPSPAFYSASPYGQLRRR